MRLAGSGTLVAGEPGTARACYTFPSVVALANGTLLATTRRGSTKDGDDDEVIVLADHGDGRGWVAHPPLPASPIVDGRRGTLKLTYLTELRPGQLVAAAMWVDRDSYPGRPLFNPETEGCLPMAILLARSGDGGQSWTAWSPVAVPTEIGPPSLTSPLFVLDDGRLAMSLETNKHYFDSGIWRQLAVLMLSDDDGVSWGEPVVSAVDPDGRVFNWDLRIAAAPDGRLVSFAWTFDREAGVYRNIHRRISADRGASWSAPEDIGIADQAARPAILADGRLVLAWVDRFGTRSIRARLAQSIDGPLQAESEVVVYAHQPETGAGDDGSVSAALAEMDVWSFGLPSATVTAEGEVTVVYYAGTPERMDIRWARLAL